MKTLDHITWQFRSLTREELQDRIAQKKLEISIHLDSRRPNWETGGLVWDRKTNTLAMELRELEEAERNES